MDLPAGWRADKLPQIRHGPNVTELPGAVASTGRDGAGSVSATRFAGHCRQPMSDPTLPGYFSRSALIGAAVVVAVIALLVVALASWEIPAPKTRIEKVIPNDRLPR
jgi:hypothetical protein